MQSVKKYTEDLYEYINAYLRGDQFGEEDGQYYEKLIKDIDSMMEPLESPMLVFRGINEAPIFGIQEAYTSTSTNMDVVKSHGKYILAITLTTGIPHIDLRVISSIQEEEEILLGHDINLKLIYQDKDVYYCVASK